MRRDHNMRGAVVYWIADYKRCIGDAEMTDDLAHVDTAQLLLIAAKLQKEANEKQSLASKIRREVKRRIRDARNGQQTERD